jgi:hypothetical protein
MCMCVLVCLCGKLPIISCVYSNGRQFYCSPTRADKNYVKRLNISVILCSVVTYIGSNVSEEPFKSIFRLRVSYVRKYPHLNIYRIWGRHSDSYEKFYILRAMFATCFQIVFLLSLFFDPEDGDNMLLRNVGWISTTTLRYTAEGRPLHNHMSLFVLPFTKLSVTELYRAEW